MPFVEHNQAEEIPWRPNYRVWSVAGMEQQVDCTLHYSEIEPGYGAPMHIHEVDELITVLKGELEGRLGDEQRSLLPNQTMVIPKGVAHGFTAAGSGTAIALAYFPCADGMQNTSYLEGEPPAAYRDK